jgi:hypothetical protein
MRSSDRETLFLELRAIEYWNVEYYRSRHPTRLEREAYIARQSRREEILRKLTSDRVLSVSFLPNQVPSKPG